jgi:hypothetical protein
MDVSVYMRANHDANAVAVGHGDGMDDAGPCSFIDMAEIFEVSPFQH